MTGATPATPTAPGAAAVPVAGVKPTPKKDTVRIEVPGAKQVPQATVKLQQTQPLIRPPQAEVRTLAAPMVATTTADADEVVTGEDPTVTMISWGVLAFSVIVLVLQVLTFISK